MWLTVSRRYRHIRGMALPRRASGSVGAGAQWRNNATCAFVARSGLQRQQQTHVRRHVSDLPRSAAKHVASHVGSAKGPPDANARLHARPWRRGLRFHFPRLQALGCNCACLSTIRQSALCAARRESWGAARMRCIRLGDSCTFGPWLPTIVPSVNSSFGFIDRSSKHSPGSRVGLRSELFLNCCGKLCATRTTHTSSWAEAFLNRCFRFDHRICGLGQLVLPRTVVHQIGLFVACRHMEAAQGPKAA